MCDHVVIGIELSERGADPVSIWDPFESHERLAECAGSRESDPAQAEVETGACGGSGWGLGERAGCHGGGGSGRWAAAGNRGNR